MSERVVVLCPGRGSYGAGQLGSLRGLRDDPRTAALRDWIDTLDRRRSEEGLDELAALDGAERFGSRLLRAENAAPLIFAVTARDRLLLSPSTVRVVAVGGNSMGWYSALFAAGALELAEAGRLVETMARITDESADGGQILYPLVDERWLPATEAAESVEAALEAAREAGGRAGHSIRYGGYAVLWADPRGLSALSERLPALELGGQRYPLRLGGNGPFHSALMQEGAEEARAALADLRWRPPEIPMIDGRGAQWRPLSADPEELVDYTLDTQVTETFDFAATVRVALREYAPDRLVLLGPGDTLGGAVAQVLIRERWRGIDSREAFLERQREDPPVISMARPEQAARVL